LDFSIKGNKIKEREGKQNEKADYCIYDVLYPIHVTKASVCINEFVEIGGPSLENSFSYTKANACKTGPPISTN